MPEFTSDGVQLHYITSGAPAPGRLPVLLMHGFASNIEMNWVSTRWVADLTAAGYHVVAFDHRGHGQSQKLYRPQDYGSNVMAEDARRLLDHLAIPRAHVIGYSMGARLAAVLAARHPDRVGRVVLGGIGTNFVYGMQGTDEIAAALAAPDSVALISDVGRSFRAFALQTRSDLKALAACIRPVREPLPQATFAAIEAPVLVAAGTEDDLAGPAAGLASLIRGAIAFDIEGREHMKAVGDRSFKMKVLEFLGAN